MNLRNTFALICLCEQRFHGKSVAWGQVKRQRLEETMYVALSQLLYSWDQRGSGFLKLSYGEKGKSHKQEEFLWGAVKKLPKQLTTELLYLGLTTISASFAVKRYMHYIRFVLTKTSSAKFESTFPLGYIFIYIIDFFYQSANDN